MRARAVRQKGERRGKGDETVGRSGVGRGREMGGEGETRKEDLLLSDMKTSNLKK